jgi:hypothetical protein
MIEFIIVIAVGLAVTSGYWIYWLYKWLNQNPKYMDKVIEICVTIFIKLLVGTFIVGALFFLVRDMVNGLRDSMVIKAPCSGTTGDAYYKCRDSYGDPPGFGGSGNTDSGPGIHNVDGYYRSDGTYVRPYIRSNPDGDPTNNLKR